MDPVMQALFGSMPIEQLSSVQVEIIKNNKNTTILIIDGVAIALGITAYILYQKNKELNQQFAKVKIIRP